MIKGGLQDVAPTAVRLNYVLAAKMFSEPFSDATQKSSWLSLSVKEFPYTRQVRVDAFYALLGGHAKHLQGMINLFDHHSYVPQKWTSWVADGMIYFAFSSKEDATFLKLLLD